MLTYDNIRAQHESVLLLRERITVTTFLIDYILRLWAAKIPLSRGAHGIRCSKIRVFLYRNRGPALVPSVFSSCILPLGSRSLPYAAGHESIPAFPHQHLL